MSRVPITKAAQLSELEEGDLLSGYSDGLDNEPAPGDNRSYSYWHGWRNGQVDKGFAKGDAAQAALAHDIIKTKYPLFK